MIFLLGSKNSEIIVSENWFIKGNKLITEEKAESPFWITSLHTNIIYNIVTQLQKHPNYLDLGG